LAARWADGRLLQASALNIGIAVDTPAGLMVPVVHDVSSLSLARLAATSYDLIARAGQGKVKRQEMDSGVFTVTNLGMFGVDAFTPVINYPECAILGVGRVRRVPACVGESIVPQDQMTLSLSFDHRVVDGAPAARFLQCLVRTMEELDHHEM
jgi:pyruvate dehydrogenase E2 component (dihydrolipoamide acetyltransferase)